MPPPTNISGATAVELGPLPNSINQDVNDAGTTYTVWYKYTAQAGDNVIGIFARSDDLAVYKPTIAVFTPDAVTSFPTSVSWNVPAQYPVTPGQVYYFEVSSFTGNVATAHLTISALQHVDVAVPDGAIVVPDDLPGYPMAVCDPTTGAVVLYVQNIPAGETARNWTSGVFAKECWTTFPTQTTSIMRGYSTNFVELWSTTVDPTDFQPVRISTNRVNNWYAMLAIDNNHGAAPTIQRLDSAGTVTDLFTLSPFIGANSYYRPVSIATKRDDSIAYIGDTNDGDVKRWDLVNDVAMADLTSQLPGYYPFEMMMLANDTLIVLWWTTLTNGDHGDVYLQRYDTSGALLNDYGSIGTLMDPRMSYAGDDPLSFWVHRKPYPHADGKATFRHILVADGSTIADIPTYMFEQGKFIGDPTLTPPADFGTSESCPLIVMPSGSGPPPPPNPVTRVYPMRRLRRWTIPNDENRWIFLTQLELELQRGMGLNQGQGSDPQVMFRLSRDGGKTWGPERWVSAGKTGEYTRRVILRQLGRARNPVAEITVSDPTFWALQDAYLDAEPGSS